MIKKFVILVFSLIVLSSCSGVNPDKIIAIAGKDKISLDEFELYLTSKSGKPNLVSVTPEERTAYLNDYVNIALIAREAAKTGVEDSAWFRREIENRENQWLAQYLFWNEMLKAMYDEVEIEKFHQRMGKTIYARHLLLRNSKAGKDSAAKEIDKEKLANELYLKLKSGEYDFKDVAKKYSEAPSAKSGGQIRPFTVGDHPEIEDIVFSLEPGEVSRPVETKYGYEIIILDSIIQESRIEEISSSSEFSNVAQKMISKKPRLRRKLFKTLTDSFKTKVNFSYDEEGIKSLNKKLQELSKIISMRELLVKLDNEEIVLDQPLFHYNGKTFYAADLLRDLGVMKIRYIKQLTTYKSSIGLLRKGETIFIWSEYSRMLGNENTRFFRSHKADYIRQRLDSFYKTDIIGKNLTISDEEMQSYYQANIKNYGFPDRMQIYVIRQGDIEVAAKVLKQARAGKDWNELVKKYSQGNLLEKDRHGGIGYRAKDAYGDVSKKAFEYGENKIVPELVLQGNTFFIVKTGDMQKSHARPFQEVKKDILKILREQKMDKAYQSALVKITSQNKPEILDDLSSY